MNIDEEPRPLHFRLATWTSLVGRSPRLRVAIERVVLGHYQTADHEVMAELLWVLRVHAHRRLRDRLSPELEAIEKVVYGACPVCGKPNSLTFNCSCLYRISKAKRLSGGLDVTTPTGA